MVRDDQELSLLFSVLNHVADSIPQAELFEAISSRQLDWTFFAPNNTAFERLAAELGYDAAGRGEAHLLAFLTETLEDEILLDILNYHLLAERFNVVDLEAAGPLTTVQGGIIRTGNLPSLIDGAPASADATIVLGNHDTVDYNTHSGVLVWIDRVLLPADLDALEPPEPPQPTVLDLLADGGPRFDRNGDDFDILRGAIAAAELGAALDNPLDSFTVFAPTDAAFVALAQALGYDGAGERGAFAHLVRALELLGAGDAGGLLTDVLTYHVLPEALDAAAIGALATLTTISGGTITVNGTTLGDLEPDLPNPGIIATDIEAGNGIVHVLDGVLLPADLLQSDGADDVDFVIGSNRGDTISTGADADYASGLRGRDRLELGAGDDVGLGGRGRDTIDGGAGDDIVLGGNGRDRVLGGSGDDVISGGRGNDWVSGGAGEDRFVIDAGDRRERILDFTPGEDVVDLSGFDLPGFAQLTIDDGPDGSALVTVDNFRLRIDGLTADDLDRSDFDL
jgi:uncharacterized surface protein with fasciclin (FAS1) repeats